MTEPLLDQMARTSRERALRSVALRPTEAWRERALALSPAPRLELSDFDLIAECKIRAPSAGRLAGDQVGSEQLVDRARAYAAAGACAISVLTEPLRFDGELAHLAAVASQVAVPAMRKDFLVDPVQVWEGRLAGAGGVLLITRMLDDGTLAAMLDAAAECGMFALVECFDVEDCRRTASAIGGREGVLVGVNTRDLRTLAVRSERLEALVPALPEGVPWVAESGMATPDDVGRAASLGYRLALVGTALMRAPDPSVLAAEMRAAGSAACG